jgi:hypothetical protein
MFHCFSTDRTGTSREARDQDPAAVLVARLDVRTSQLAAAPPAIQVHNAGPHVAVLTHASIRAASGDAASGKPLTPPDGKFPITLLPGADQILDPAVAVEGPATVELTCHDGRGRQRDAFTVAMPPARQAS